MSQDIGFGAVGLFTLLSALFVVQSRNLIHAVLWLAVTLLGTAVLFAMLGAQFLAGVQVLTYIGGVVTLIIFGVMVTKRHEGSGIVATQVEPVRGALAAGSLTAILLIALFKTPLPERVARDTSAAEMGRLLLTTHVLAFEAASVLLLAAIVGAVAIARRRDIDPATGEEPSSLPAFLSQGVEP